MKYTRTGGRRSRNITVRLASFVALVGVLFSFGQAVQAVNSETWHSATSVRTSIIYDMSGPDAPWYIPGCRLEMITVDTNSGFLNTRACVIDIDGARLALYQTAPFLDVSVPQPPEAEFGIVLPVIQKGNDNYFHFIYGLTDNGSYFGLTHPIVLSDGGAILTVNGSHGRTLMRIENLADRTVSVEGYSPSIGRNSKYYELDFLDLYRQDHESGQVDPVQITVEGELAWIGKVRHMAGVSNNERYIAVEAEAGGTVVADLLEQKIIKHIDTPNHQYHIVNGYAGYTKFAISNDGKLVVRLAVGHRFYPHELDSARLYFIDESCPISSEGIRHQCRYLDFTEQLYANNTDTIRPYKINFNGDETALVIKSYDNDDEHKIYTTTVHPDTSGHESLLDYLALGDSYSSGEGDIGRRADGSSYYLPATGHTRGCHLSTRSYPFLLRQAWGIAESKMQSVACSGAQVLPDYYGQLEGYLGQGGRLRGVDDLTSAQDVALQKFIPGRVPQIEFVKKYQPRVITLTGGGNDIGFSRILADCALPTWVDAISDCSYAKKDSATYEILLGSIRTQYLITKRLINNIKEASPGSKIIIVGYPIFISTVYDGPATCRPNIGNLSTRERKIINEMTSKLNNALRQAAHETQVSFVDIEKSLNGGRLCEGSEYMTGIWDWIKKRAVDDERFHPNAAGHVQIAQAIVKSGVYDNENIPSLNSFGPIGDMIKTFKEIIIKGGTILKNTTAKLTLDSGHLAPRTAYSATVYSTPKHLGIFRTNADGSIQQDVSFDGVEPGYHMLVLEGTGVDSEPVKLYQYIEVHASKSDTDGDGIPNDKDKCHFMAYLYDDRGQDVCGVADDTKHVDGDISRGKIPSTPVDDTTTDTVTGNRSTVPTVQDLGKRRESKDDKSISLKGEEAPLILIIASCFIVVIVSVVAVICRHYILKRKE